MANEEHLALLRQGVEVWNEWKNNNSYVAVDLSEADLRDAGAYLIGVNFTRTNLSGAKLIEANFNRSDLSGANLTGANLAKAEFIEADLSGANFTRANLEEASLKRAYLSRANFTKANLEGANLSLAQAVQADFTAAKLTGVCLENWNINSETNLDDVICDYVYLRQNLEERCPIDRNFVPREFTKLFQKVSSIVELIFHNGVDWDAFAYSFKKVEVENQGAQLDVQSIEKKGDGILVVRVSVSPDADKVKIYGDFMQGYEFAHKALEAQYQARLEDKDKEINKLFYLVNQLSGTPKKISNYYLPNSQFGGGVVDTETVQTHQIGGDIYNTDNQEDPD